MAPLLATLLTMAILDGLWLGVVARKFYRTHLGYLMAAKPNWVAAVIFYLIFTAGVAYFIVQPAVDANSVAQAVARGALFGLVAYATYDLTNAATIRDWPIIVTLVDIVWGTALTAAVGGIATYLVLRFG